ncbi:MAG: tRNA (adenosine(37)-N6)-dimethylallyltransferase MiaA [Bacteroidetes bacterium]|nr:MAG: tRNA (adenosine(37)-N6)-dimethylallyltransferase MiaA [Bacteroidota bacterium]
MSSCKYLIVIGGPTASGKTSFAIKIAQYFNTDIISCDSRQFYREMSIGTAKPSSEELAEVKHHFIDSLSIHDNYSVGDFEQQTIELLDQLFLSRDYVVMCGGSGLFINAVCFGLDKFPDIPNEIRKQVEEEFDTGGVEKLQAELQSSDPEYYNEVDLMNPHRLMRALEVIRHTGKPFSSFRRGKYLKRNFIPVFLQIHHPRETLYQRINQRVDLMMQANLLAEVKKLVPHQNLNALQTVGYQELFSFLNGQSTLENSIDQIKQNSRRYAKRQITWMRRDGFWKHFRPQETSAAILFISFVAQNNLVLKTLDLREEKFETEEIYPANSKVMTAAKGDALSGYFVFEIKPKKNIWHPIEMSMPDEILKEFLQHEKELLMEEYGK